MSDPRKSFVCDQGHVVSDSPGQRPWGKQSICRCCKAEDVPVFAIQRAHAKSELTSLQYNGGPHMTTQDHISIFRVISDVFRHLPPSVPHEADGEWGFKQWANHITHGRW